MAKVEAEVRPDTADYLRREAISRGIPVEQLAGGLLDQAIDHPYHKAPQPSSAEERVARFLEWANSQDPNIPPIPLEALSRESLYDEDE